MWHFLTNILFYDNITINQIDKLLLDFRNKFRIITNNRSEDNNYLNLNDPIIINILHYYLYTKNDPNRLLNIIYEDNENKLYINTDVIDNYINQPIFNMVCYIIVRNKTRHIKNISPLDNTNFIPYIINSQLNKELTDSFNIKLFDYQKKTIMRMIEIENNLNMTFDRNIKINIDDREILWDPHYEKITTEPAISLVISNGGILADTMGLGKTITAIGLMHFGKIWSEEEILLFNNNTNVNKILYSKATFIIVPSHLAKQWVDEYVKAHNNTKKIIVILTRIHHNKITYQDIMEADVVIVTIQFLLNIKNYCTINYEGLRNISNFDYDDRYETIINNHNQMMRGNKYLNTTKPLFECFHFNRVIIDEGHEIMETDTINYRVGAFIHRFIKDIKSKYKWYISGTPFITHNGLINIMNYLDVQLIINDDTIKIKSNNYSNDIKIDNTTYRDIYPYLSTEETLKTILSTFTIRHLKNDTNVNLLGYNEKIEWVELTKPEKKIYESKLHCNKSDRKLLQQICCHPVISDNFKKIIGSETTSLENVQDKLIHHHTKIIDIYTKKIEYLDRTNKSYNMLLKNYQTKIAESKFILSTLEKITENSFDNEENTCVICYDIMSEPIMTPCAHLFCSNCINTCIKIKPECPMCKGSIKLNQLVNVKKKEDTIEEHINPLTAKYGSKLGKLIQMVRTLLTQDARIIIFSQWDEMLLLIRKSLLENGVDCSFISGNVYKRNKAISKFKLGGNNNSVILLSLENSASGTNLTEASHIFFVEPIDHIKESINAIEGQAIGRAVRLGQKQVVEIIRILCKDTIEEEIYNTKYL